MFNNNTIEDCYSFNEHKTHLHNDTQFDVIRD